ncbi:hypothetical protein [Paenibacillus mucilaginosus]|uniref:Uncharacterized protein n=1 Tax=Paenibacillus mucilaginosus (strain KNP414) TaxID=1036673 RepID=F8FHA6_PAEMK|nr:hypothetical protein [Paenibacillus mucilaginosus]AEI39808.1 hypothetical protein KNP414_01243 [Paenibacillus mucilaginosus KNP414]MCG7217883.1 hypothetical protein [Paenibacillus mucilaginosus]WDM29091.1 hypothetical protein KCX80_07975 [Paenibacillus mucilaginosus]
METGLKGNLKSIVFLIGILTIGNYGLDAADYIHTKFDDSKQFKKQIKKDEEIIGNTYSRGVYWGEENAEQATMENEKNITDRAELRQLAIRYLNSREHDFVCYGPSDEECDEMPTPDDIKTKWIKPKYGPEELQLKAFQSGFIDGFIEYYIYNQQSFFDSLKNPE